LAYRAREKAQSVINSTRLQRHTVTLEFLATADRIATHCTFFLKQFRRSCKSGVAQICLVHQAIVSLYNRLQQWTGEIEELN